MKNDTASRIITSGQMKDLGSALMQGVPKDLAFKYAEYWIGHKKDLALEIKTVLESAERRLNLEFKLFIDQWKIFYDKYFQLDFSNLEIPEKQSGFDRLIIIAQGLTLNQIHGVCSKQFACDKYTDDLDKAIVKNDRTSEQAYAIWVRDRQRADEELKNLSANDLAEKNIPTITLLERLIYELKYWDETGQHLDINDITLCAGSRRFDGGVPSVDWYNGNFRVIWCNSYGADSNIRARAVVPL
jgi:hypothetical protein